MRARAVGAVHNLSVDVVSIAPIVECRCIPALVAMLRDPSIEICRAATGTIQNLSRDISVRASIVDSGALDYLSDLLFANDITCQVFLQYYGGLVSVAYSCDISLFYQVAAVGTILNIVGSTLRTPEEHQQLRQALSDGVALGAIRSCVFD